MEYTGDGFLFGFVVARHRSSASFEISYLCECAEVIMHSYSVGYYYHTIDFVCIAVTHIIKRLLGKNL